MKSEMAVVLGIATVLGSILFVSCSEKPGSVGVGQETGAAMDRAAEKTVEVATNVAGQVVDKTGKAMEKAGAAVEKTGENMQK